MIYGIDLGTTFSAIAHVNPLNAPVCIPLQEGGKWAIPSAVLFVPGGQVYVGEDAITNSYIPDSLLVEYVKRDIGMQSNKRWSYEGWDYTPEEISALILRKVAQTVGNARTLPPVKDVVVSHPQYFWMNQKEATREAVELAGLNLVSTITEPGAAAIAYGVLSHGEEAEKTVLVFDLGGGTFDVTLMRLGGSNRFQMIGSEGDARLGGMNWDSEIIGLAKEMFHNAWGDKGDDFDSLASEEEKILLRKAAEATKVALSNPNKESHRFWLEAGGNKLPIDITRKSFAEMGRGLVARCLERCERLFRQTGSSWEKVDEVLLVGSSTKMPMIQDAVRQASGREPLIDSDPKLMVAKGAAIWGHWVSNRLIDARWSDAEEADVAGLEVRESPEVAGCTAHGLGVLATRNNRQIVKILVQQNTATPFEAEETFYTDKDGATTVYVPLYEGESEEVESCNSIGSAKLDNVPSRPKGQAVKVKFKIDIAGRLEVRVKDVETQREEVKSVNRNVLRSGDSLSIEKDFETRRRHLAQLVIL